MGRKQTELDVVWEEDAQEWIVCTKGGDDLYDTFSEQQDAWDFVRRWYDDRGIPWEWYDDEK